MPLSEIGKLFEHCLKCLRKTRIPLFSSRFSKKTYTQHQHLALLVLKTYLKLDYRKTSELAEELWSSVEILNLPKVPHFTTLQKFFSRIPNTWLALLLCKVLHHFKAIEYLAIDATGFSAERASKYYQLRAKGMTPYANFLKMSLLLDVKRRLPIAVRCHNRNRNDVVDFLPLMQKVKKPVKYMVADKAYDAKATFELLRRRNIKAIIPLKMGKLRVKAKLRKRMLREWAKNPAIERQYHQRSLIESVFSSLKRRFGSEVRSRLWHLQRREAMLKVLVYSISRRIEYWFAGGFLQSLRFLRFRGVVCQ